jgi:UDP-N-acetylmuramoyl-tripeptide--D-alanyl-D-alanine ligase
MNGLAWTTAAVAEAMGAVMHGHDAPLRGVSIDSRRIQPGNLFIALSGERVDGHDYVAQAAKSGAVAVAVERDIDAPISRLVVDDAKVALGRLGAAWRGQFDVPLVGITGSNGKTTVKEMVASIAAQVGEPLATRGNLNNELGVPLTLCELDQRHRSAIVEMGANHIGEIAYLASLAKPLVGIVTQCAPAHLEGFGSIEGVAQGKGELFTSLPTHGCAVINADDDYANFWKGLTTANRTLTFGLDNAADVTGEWSYGPRGIELHIVCPQGHIRADLSLLGRHNVLNALAATAGACALGFNARAISRGLSNMRPVPGRLALTTRADGLRVIDDSYNANPTSTGAAINVLSGFEGHRCLVLGDMAELGTSSVDLHREVGALAAQSGIERLYTTGKTSRAAALAFGSGAQHFDSCEKLSAFLRGDVDSGAVILVKGSRSMRMERVVSALAAER